MSFPDSYEQRIEAPCVVLLDGFGTLYGKFFQVNRLSTLGLGENVPRPAAVSAVIRRRPGER